MPQSTMRGDYNLDSEPQLHAAPQLTAPGPALTVLLQTWQNGDGQVFAQLFQRVYDQLKQIAAQRLREGSGDTLSPTELAPAQRSALSSQT